MTRKQATIAVRSGLNDDEQYGCVVPPIHLSSTYNFTGFNEPRAHDYSRRGNPTRDVVQRALAELEGGAGAVLTNTGMSAIHLVTTVFLKPGDLLVAPHDCYGGSYRLFDSLAKRGCYRVLFVDQSDEQALRAALAENPKLVLVESPSNPLLRVVDIAKICHLAREVGAVSVVDNTFLSPALQNPLALGADLVLHSCTKYLNGHSDVVAGVVIAKDPDVVTELAWWANNIGVTGGPDGVARRGAAGHGAGIGAVQGQLASIRGHDVGEKPFVTFNQDGGLQGRSEQHQLSLSKG